VADAASHRLALAVIGEARPNGSPGPRTVAERGGPWVPRDDPVSAARRKLAQRLNRTLEVVLSAEAVTIDA
jgi:hypothetical protein